MTTTTHGTHAETRKRVSQIYTLLLQGIDREGIMATADKLGWGVSTNMIDKYTGKARERLEAKCERDEDFELGRAKARLDDLYRRCWDESGKLRDLRGALAVLAERHKLLGLHAPVEVIITDAMLRDEKARLEAALAQETDGGTAGD